MRRFVMLFLVLCGFAGLATAQTVVGSTHDLSGAGLGNTPEVCVYCHTPHQATTAGAQEPLWNHTLQTLTTTYGVYTSSTLNATPTEIGNVTLGSASASFLCMSCHDGTVAPSSLYNEPNSGAPAAIGAITGDSNLGTVLVDDHPINFDYNAALVTADNGGLKTPDSASSVDAAGNIPLFASSVQCASCHNPHDPTNTPFLRVSNTGSALCTSCHNK